MSIAFMLGNAKRTKVSTTIGEFMGGKIKKVAIRDQSVPRNKWWVVWLLKK
jgi:hypothetical protein